MMRRLAHALVRHYPLAWRERYESEVCALIDDSSLRIRDLAEFVRGLLTERVRELVGSAERPRRTRFVVLSMKAVFWLGLCVLGPAAGLALRHFTGPWSVQAREVAALLALAFAVAFFTFFMTRARRRIRPYSIHQPYPAWVAITLLPCLLLADALVMASFDGSTPWFNCFFFPFLQELVSSLPWPSQPLLSAFAAVRVIERNLTFSQQWVDGCREMIAKGVPSPLGEAEAQFADLENQLEQARELMYSLGYRARFRQDLGMPSAASPDQG